MSPVRTAAEHRLGPASRIPVGEGREYEVAGRLVAVFRLRGGGVTATDARCPHRGGPLADGIVGMDSVVCPLHAWRFSFGSGRVLGGDCDVATHPVRLDEEGDILLTLADPDPLPPAAAPPPG